MEASGVHLSNKMMMLGCSKRNTIQWNPVNATTVGP